MSVEASNRDQIFSRILIKCLDSLFTILKKVLESLIAKFVKRTTNNQTFNCRHNKDAELSFDGPTRTLKLPIKLKKVTDIEVINA